MSAAERLKEYLGEEISVEEMAKILGVDPRTARKYAHRWGGVEVYPGRPVFFENVVRRIIDAELVQQAQIGSITRASTDSANQWHVSACPIAGVSWSRPRFQ